MIQKINKELSILVVGRVIQILIMLVSIKISTALLNPVEMGNLYMIASICSFFGFFFMNPIGQYINRNAYAWQHNGLLLNKLFNYNYYILSASVLSFFVTIILYDIGFANKVNYILFILLIPLFVYFNTWSQTIIPMINMFEQRGVFTLLTILTLILSLVFAYAIVYMFEKSGVLWFLGQIIGLALIAIVGFIFFIKTIENKFNLSIAHSEIAWVDMKNILSFAFPLSIAVLFLWMQNQSYRLIIEKYIGPDFLGHFGVGMAIAIAISTSFETIVMQLLYPKMYKNMNNEIEFEIIFSNIINIILPIYFLLAVCVSFLAMYLTTILVDAKYASSFTFVIFGIWIEFFRMSSNLISTIAHSKMQTKSLILPYAIGGIFVVMGTYFASLFQNYQLLIPIVLIIGSFLTFLQMFQKMNKLITINLKLVRFIQILPYTLVFFLTIFLHNYSSNIYSSIIITLIFGIYFLFLLYKIIHIKDPYYEQ